MKFGLIVVGLTVSCLSLPTLAATLKLGPQVEVLVVDGKKASNTLLKGSNGLELASGTHQILFRVEDTVKVGSRDQQLYSSSPLIATFDATNAKTVTISLPKIETERDSKKFERELNYSIIDENGKAIDSKQDVLRIQGITLGADLEVEMAKYNLGDNQASVPALAASNSLTMAGMQIPISTVAGVPVTQTSLTLKGENVSEQMLQYWYQQADKETQQRFLNWAKKNSAK